MLARIAQVRAERPAALPGRSWARGTTDLWLSNGCICYQTEFLFMQCYSWELHIIKKCMFA